MSCVLWTISSRIIVPLFMSCIYTLSFQHLNNHYCTNKSRTLLLFHVGEIKSSSFDADIPPYDEDPPGDDDVISDTGDDAGDEDGDKDGDGDGDDMYGDLGGEEGNAEDGDNDDNDDNGATSAAIDADGMDSLVDSTGIYRVSLHYHIIVLAFKLI